MKMIYKFVVLSALGFSSCMFCVRRYGSWADQGYSCDPVVVREVAAQWDRDIDACKYIPDYEEFFARGGFPFLGCAPEGLSDAILAGIAAAVNSPEVPEVFLSSYFGHRADFGVRRYLIEKKDIFTSFFAQRLFVLLDKEDFGLTNHDVYVVQRLLKKYPELAFSMMFGRFSDPSGRVRPVLDKLFFGLLQRMCGVYPQGDARSIYDTLRADEGKWVVFVFDNTVDFLVAQLDMLRRPFAGISSEIDVLARKESKGMMKEWGKAIKNHLHNDYYPFYFDRMRALVQSCAYVILLNGTIVETGCFGDR
ncbi:TPA: hypothetical protein DDZ86_01960 [Candidatus Dependentiae bacterium]|nr:MAG: hypothetical protein UW09_C0001G0246 [candidate division TM6 bacterium GW2011_GWF2_43_87]HBL98389.1 hypothetical protein [Candidatus Dependentiae bacterium]